MSRKGAIIERLAKKTIAVSSGKGGVGKTTTAVNLGLYFAKKNLRIGLIDLDPLSDVAALLDFEDPESVFKKTFDGRKKDFASHVYNIFDNFDLIFPYSKLARENSMNLLEKLYTGFVKELNQRYDLLIFDLPAGVRFEDNLIFLQYTGNLVLVTNAEPSAHVSAGGYIKSALEYEPGLRILLWHNKFNRMPGQHFDPTDVVGNYNRNVSAEERLSADVKNRISNLARIPNDAALDLLQMHPSPKLNLLRTILDLTEFFQERRLEDLAKNIKLSPRLFDIIKYFLIHTEKIVNISQYLDSFGAYLKKILENDIIMKEGRGKTLRQVGELSGLALFSAQERDLLERYLTKVKADGVLMYANRLINLLEKSVNQAEQSEGQFQTARGEDLHKPVDMTIGRTLELLNVRYNEMGPDVKNSAGLLLFYFSLYKLFQSPTVLKLIMDFIPKRKNTRGRVVRDKKRQINDLLKKSREYDQRYFQLIKTLYPVVNRQLETVIKTFQLSNLVLKDKKGGINKLAYLTLFTNFLHETVNSGLSVIIGFKHRPAARAFSEAAESLLKIVGDNEHR